MQKKRLGQSDIHISQIALGTMTWGEQNSREEAFAQMDYAREHDINFFDTAELYAIPPRAETYGATEAIIGAWFKKTGRRSEVVLASKVCGPTAWCPHIREGKARLDKSNIIAACDASLQRLQTDYIDLYQTHWPERSTNYFGKLNYQHEEESFTAIAETLEALSGLVEAGKVRHIGISNETPWGAMQYLRCAELMGLSRIVSIQNPYNLLNRSFEVGLAEIACREEVGLLAYSPLAFGVLSGKYLNNDPPTTGRLSMFGHYTRYSNLYGKLATAAYVEVARKHDLNPAQMALAFIRQQPFVSSTIIGATTMAQLIDNIASHEVTLSDECCADIESVFRQYPNPCP
ncbi:NADP(H)-dependent aldo-keto reductase [Mariprofundus sp. KV]|uniref:NADP(H)-dependent aldo-keto reductase n=1 Tax=Mariprofundus sp. KV TaxID=2608715 RepID=UPI0015A19894|nr:NADP(H)-dependent aldo-keto reductase [Mariprofundus sp. KV]NWF35969.1 NADP(H)-dependent aldo-keto reductase [Mariprofundus sp. KV]